MAEASPTPGENKYEAITVSGKDIPPDEPLFLLRSQDELGPETVTWYANLLEMSGLPDQAADVRAFASRMRRWQIEHPDRVKLPD